VISELQKPNCHQNIKIFAQEMPWDSLYLSAITIGELCYGMEKLPSGKKKHDLAIWLYTKVPEWFRRRIIPLETEVLLEWGKIHALTKKTLPVADTLIAASAITHRMFLVTRNVKDFDDIDGLNILNPWEF
jgi:predicted nucleic acid-binding protein